MNTTEQMLFINDNGEVACGRNGHGGNYLNNEVDRLIDDLIEMTFIETPRGSWVTMSAGRALHMLGTGCESCK
jgi:hypothetical protein